MDDFFSYIKGYLLFAVKGVLVLLFLSCIYKWAVDHKLIHPAKALYAVSLINGRFGFGF